jgi:hypothetical protein
MVDNPDPRFAVHYNLAIDDLAKTNPNMTLAEAVPAATEKAKTSTAAYQEDPTFYRYAIILLTVIVLAVVATATLLVGLGKAPSDGIVAIGSGAVGALIGLFSSQKT